MWMVMIGNKELGIIETNYAFASKYWIGRKLGERSFWLKELPLRTAQRIRRRLR